MEEKQSPTPEPTAQSVVIAPAGPASLQPDPNLSAATIGVSAAARAGNLSSAYQDLPQSTPMKSPDIPTSWTPTKRPAFSNPRTVLLFSLFGVVAVILFLTFGIGINIWIKVILLLALSAGGLFSAMRAYESDNNTAILLSIIISTMLCVGTVIVGTTYLYYTYKFKQVTNSIQSSY